MTTMRVLILLAFLGTALAVPKTVTRIVGGEDTTVERYPYMANMQYLVNSMWTQFCGGSLLNSAFVLSAAHCYEGDSPAQWRVRLGTTYSSSGGSVHLVSSIIMHELYNEPFLDNDVALIRLANPAVYSDLVQPVRIAGVNYVVPEGTPVIAVGWGSLFYAGPSPEILQHVDIKIISQDLCEERYAFLKGQPGYHSWPLVSDGMICAGIVDWGGKDACHGDSGGPLVYEADGDVLVGITSWGYGCADRWYPGVNVRVSFFSDWIVQNAQ